MPDSFVHLHVHTEYSMLDGAARLTDLVRETSRMGMPALAMTDHGNLYGAYDFYKQAKAAGIKPVIGTEAYVSPESRFLKRAVLWGEGGESDVSGRGAYLHMTLLAATQEGLHNLYRLSSLASLAGILGPVLATGLFGFFISARAPVRVPGAAFFCGSLLMLIALQLALRSFRKNPPAATPARA